MRGLKCPTKTTELARKVLHPKRAFQRPTLKAHVCTPKTNEGHGEPSHVLHRREQSGGWLSCPLLERSWLPFPRPVWEAKERGAGCCPVAGSQVSTRHLGFLFIPLNIMTCWFAQGLFVSRRHDLEQKERLPVKPGREAERIRKELNNAGNPVESIRKTRQHPQGLTWMCPSGSNGVSKRRGEPQTQDAWRLLD